MQRLHTLQDNLFKIGAPYLDKKTKQYTDLPLGDFPFAIGILYQTNVSQNEIAELMGVTATNRTNIEFAIIGAVILAGVIADEVVKRYAVRRRAARELAAESAGGGKS